MVNLLLANSPVEKRAPPYLEALHTWGTAYPGTGGATQPKGADTQPQCWKEYHKAAGSTHGEKARRGWLETEWGRWLFGEERGFNGSQRPKNGAGRGP